MFALLRNLKYAGHKKKKKSGMLPEKRTLIQHPIIIIDDVITR